MHHKTKGIKVDIIKLNTIPDGGRNKKLKDTQPIQNSVPNSVPDLQNKTSQKSANNKQFMAQSSRNIEAEKGAVGRKSAARQRPQAVLSPEYREADEEFFRAGSEPRSVTLLYNKDELPAGQPIDAHFGPGEFRDDLFVEPERLALSELGHEVTPLGVSYRNLQLLQDITSEFVFNTCDGTGLDGDPGIEVLIALEKKVIPYSGVGSAPTHLTNDKFLMKACLAARGVAVPAGTTMANPADKLPPGLTYPLFVKPRYGWGSQGVDQYSVVRSDKELAAAVEKIIKLSGIDAIVEEYIDGRELTVGVIGTGDKIVVMPPLEVRFGREYEGIPKVRMYETKQDTNSPLYWGFNTCCPAPVPEDVLKRIELTARDAYQAVGADGFGRVDIRLGADGVPYVLEVNANCSLEYADNQHDAGVFVLISKALGWSFSDALARILGAGLRRPIRAYRLPKMTLRQENGAISALSTISVQKGALLAPLGRFVRGRRLDRCINGSAGQKLRPEPNARFMAHSTQPNVGLYFSRGTYWLQALRALKADELLTFDWEQKIEVQAESLPLIASSPARVARRLRLRR